MVEKNSEMKQREDSRERCVVCGEYTDMQRDWPLEMRKYYIEGAGQLCEECYYELYK